MREMGCRGELDEGERGRRQRGWREGDVVEGGEGGIKEGQWGKEWWEESWEVEGKWMRDIGVRKVEDTEC